MAEAQSNTGGFPSLKLCAFAPLCLCAFVFYNPSAFSQDLLTDIPSNHWARKAVVQLMEKGILSAYPDKSFRGEQVVTRYEMAAMLSKLLDKAGGLPFKDLTPEDASVLKNLLKEFKPEMASLLDTGKLKSQMTELEKDIKKAEKSIKGFDKDIKKLKTGVKKDISSLSRSIQGVKEDMNRITFFGNGEFVMENTDYYAKGIEQKTKFITDCCDYSQQGFNRGLAFTGTAPPSVFNIRDKYQLNIKAAPTSLPQKERDVFVLSSFFAERFLGSGGTGNPNLTLNNLLLEYTAYREKFTKLRAGNVATGWTYLTLPLDFTYQGFLSQSTVKGITFDLIVSRLQKDTSFNIDTKKMYAEYLYGGSFFTHYLGANTLKVSFFKHYQDRDSVYIPIKEVVAMPTGKDKAKDIKTFDDIVTFKKKEIPENVLPFDNRVMSFSLNHQVIDSLWLRGEYAKSNFSRLVVPQGLDIEEADELQKTLCPTCSTFPALVSFPKTPSQTTNATSVFFVGDYTSRGLNLPILYANENENFKNEFGGLRKILTDIEAADFGSLDLLPWFGGFRATGLFFAKYTPSWGQKMTFGLPYIQGEESKPAKLTKTVEQALKDAGVSDEVGKDIEKRTSPLKFKVVAPSVEYKPSYKTIVTLEYFQTEATMSPETISGVEGTANSFTASAPNPTFTDERATNSFFSYTRSDGVNETVIIYPTEVGFCTTNCSAAAVNSTKQPINLSQGQPLPLNVSGTCKYQDVSVPCAGSYQFFEVKNDANEVTSTQIRRITDKQVAMNVKLTAPRITLVHQFSKQLKYFLEWTEEKVKIAEVKLPLKSNVPSARTVLEKIIKSQRTTTISNLFTYALWPNVDFLFSYNLELRRAFQCLDPGEDANCNGKLDAGEDANGNGQLEAGKGHSEKKQFFRFLMRMTF